MGISYEYALRLPGMSVRCAPRAPSVVLELADKGEIDAAWSRAEQPPLWQTVFSDGASYRIERGREGDHLLVYSDRAVFHLDAPRQRLRCAPADMGDHRWQRVLLDDVFYAVSALHGYALLHCGAVATDLGTIAICAGTGGGKTTLTAELIRRGGALVCDDLLAVERTPGGPIAHPAPAVMSVSRTARERDKSPPGRLLGVLPGEDELWIEVDRAGVSRGPLTAIFVLSRAAGVEPTARRRRATVIDLLPYAIGIGLAPEHRAGKFQALSDVAEKVPVFDLTIPLDLAPAESAALLESALR
jgi:hypothetical protein